MFTTSSFNPRFNIVSIIPGIDALAPERTETNNGFSVLPNFLPVIFSNSDKVLNICVLISSEIFCSSL